MSGLLGGFFNFVDPILDTIDPMHNQVQTWTTGSETTKGQSPYFETIAPLIVDAFFPGVGSAIGAVDKGSNGNWGGAALSALGSYAQMGSLGSAASSGANGGLAATESAGTGLASTGGEAAGSVSSGAEIASSADAANAATMAENTSSLGSGLSAPAASSYSAYQPAYTGFSGGAEGGGLLASQSTGMSGGSVGGAYGGSAVAPSQYVGAATGLNATGTASASELAANQPWYSRMNTPSTGKMAGALGEQMIKQQAAQDQRNAEAKARAQQAMGQFASPGDNAQRSYSIQNASPYAQFNGGFNPKRYGANVRKTGLLG